MADLGVSDGAGVFLVMFGFALNGGLRDVVVVGDEFHDPVQDIV